MKYKIIANEHQIRVISDALESYARLGIGQLENVLMDLGFKTYDQFKDKMLKFHDLEVKNAVAVIKNKIFDMSLNSSYSIGNNNVHKDFKVCYDLYMTLKHKLYESDAEKVKMTASSEDVKVSDNGNITIEVCTEENENNGKT